jgi:hypothetical protein
MRFRCTPSGGSERTRECRRPYTWGDVRPSIRTSRVLLRHCRSSHYWGMGTRRKNSNGGWSAPLCSFHFSHREHNRAGRTWPNCKVSVGIPFYYRVILASVGYFFMALVMYVGYQDMGSTWLLMGLPFALLAALIIQAAGYIILPPRLQAHTEGGTWLKLS